MTSYIFAIFFTMSALLGLFLTMLWLSPFVGLLAILIVPQAWMEGKKYGSNLVRYFRNEISYSEI